MNDSFFSFLLSSTSNFGEANNEKSEVNEINLLTLTMLNDK